MYVSFCMMHKALWVKIHQEKTNTQKDTWIFPVAGQEPLRVTSIICLHINWILYPLATEFLSYLPAGTFNMIHSSKNSSLTVPLADYLMDLLFVIM